MAAYVKVLQVHQSIYERSGGWLGHGLLGMPTLLLRTHGRRTGLERTVALVYATDGDDLLVVASNGGHHKPPAWLLNLTAQPEIEIQVGRKRRRVLATPVFPGGDDYERRFALCNAVNKGRYAAYQKKTERPIPVVVLSPA